MGEAAAVDLGQNHAVVGIGGMDDLTAPDIYPDVTLMPESQPRRFGERINRAFFCCIFVHGVRTDIGHTVCTVCDTAAFTVVPAVVLNQSDAVRSPSAEPVCLDKVCLAADLIGVLLGFRVQRFLSKHLTVGSPYNVLLQYFFVVEWLVDGIEQGELAERLGENGKNAYNYTLEHSSAGEESVRPAFMAYYTYGLSGSRFENVPGEFSGALDAESARRAWFAGQNDGEISLRQEQQRAGYATTAGKDSGLVYDDFVKEAVTGGRARVDVNGEERVYLSAETAERVNQVAKALGLRVQFADSVREGSANAQITGSTVLVEKNNPNPVMAIVGHEFTHRMQELAPEEYRRFRESILEGREALVEERLRQYAAQGVNLTYEQAMDEVAADEAGLLMDGGKALDDFIQQHRTDRTLLEKIRDAIRSFIHKLTGREKRQAQTAEGKLTAALEAAGKRAKALQYKAASDTMGAGKYSLKEDENNGITEENHRAEKGSGGISESGYNSQQETSDTGRSGQNRQGVGSEVRSEVGSTVRREDFLREHRERGDRSVRLKGDYLYAYHEATPLYAVGGKKAAEQYAKFRIWMKGIKNETDGNRTSFDRWNGSIQSAPWNQRTNLSDTGRRETVSGHDSLYAGASEGNRGGTPGTGAENRRVNSKFSLKAPVEETRDLVAASAPTEYAESGRWQSAAEQAKSLQDKAASDTMNVTGHSLKEDGVDGQEADRIGRTDTEIVENRPGRGREFDHEGRTGNQTDGKGLDVSDRRRAQGVNPSFGENPYHTWARGHVIEPTRGTVAYGEQQTAMEYHVPSFVVSDEAWSQGKVNAPAFSTHGQIYLRETIPDSYRNMVTPHEVTHVMRQVEFSPYLDFWSGRPRC